MAKGLLLRAMVIACWPLLTGFVLLGKDAATLPVTVDSPSVELLWDGKAPSISEKEKFADGSFADNNDAEIMERILKKAAATWSNIPGSFLRLVVNANTAAVEDPSDKKYSITVKALESASEGGVARPIVTDGLIEDCDIALPPSSIDANALLHTLTHEFGHCLGLGHAHTNYGAIMGYSGSSDQTELGADDISGAIYLYADPNDTEAKKFRQLIGIGCGSIGTQQSGNAAWMVLVALLLPLVTVVNWRRGDH